MAKLPGLVQKGRTWFLHRRWPKAVAHHFSSTHISESLKTRDYNEAVRRYHRRMAELESEWAELQTWTPEKLTVARDIIREGQLWGWGQSLTLQSEMPDRAIPGCTIDDMPVWLIKLVANRDSFLPEEPSQGAALRDEFPGWEVREHARLALRNMVRNDGTEYLKWLQKRQEQLRLDGLTGTPLPMSPSRFDALVVKGKAPSPRKKGMRTLSDVLKAWQAERDPTEKTVDEYRAKIRRFEEVHPDLTIDAITKGDVGEFTDQLRQMPLHLNNEERTKPLPELVEKYQDQPIGRVSQKTIKKHVDCVRTLIRFARDKGWIDANPLEGLKVALPTDRPGRRPFDTKQFEKVITYASQFDDERFWLPVLALYTGARLNELGQLGTADVRQADGVTYIAITADDGKHTKNVGSIREVPLHKDVLDAGFLQYVSSQGAGRLFPNLKPDKYGNLTSSYSKRFSRDLRGTIGVTDKSRVFHSFRHALKDLCRNVDIPRDVHDQITGHRDRSASTGYGLGHSLATVDRYLQRIKTGIHLPTKTYKPAKAEGNRDA